MTTVMFYPERTNPPRTGPIAFDSITLKPGTNTNINVEALRSHPDFDQYLVWDAIKIIEPKETISLDAPQPTILELAKLNVDEATKVVEGCHDIPQLDQWLAVEQRVTLRRVINDRIAAIKGGKE